MSKLRIAIVNDMKLMVEHLKRILAATHNCELAWIAYDGQEAVKNCLIDRPDIILMDLIMPVMNGVEATKRIMEKTPCAILVVTFSVGANASLVFEAMGYGALDAVSAPSLEIFGEDKKARELLEKIEIISKLLGRYTFQANYQSLRPTIPSIAERHDPPLLVIGASTGGPHALNCVLSTFPIDFPMATVIIQHVDQQFAQDLAQWLEKGTKVPVQIAYDGCRPTKGVVWLAGTNDHLVMTANGQLKYSAQPKDNPYRPSVDVFFTSLAENWPHIGIAVLLTGMGHDGAYGLKLLHEEGWTTYVQDEQSAVVFGMPKAAIQMNAVTQVLPLQEIGSVIVTQARKKYV